MLLPPEEDKNKEEEQEDEEEGPQSHLNLIWDEAEVDNEDDDDDDVMKEAGVRNALTRENVPHNKEGSLPILQVPNRLMNVWCGRPNEIMAPLPF